MQSLSPDGHFHTNGSSKSELNAREVDFVSSGSADLQTCRKKAPGDKCLVPLVVRSWGSRENWRHCPPKYTGVSSWTGLI